MNDETFPGLLLVRPEGRIFFANAQCIGAQLLPLIDAAKPRVVVMDFSAVPDIEYSPLKMLIKGEARLRERGSLLWLVALNPEVWGMVQRSSLGESLGRERSLYNLPTAVALQGSQGVTAGAPWAAPRKRAEAENKQVMLPARSGQLRSHATEFRFKTPTAKASRRAWRPCDAATDVD